MTTVAYGLGKDIDIIGGYSAFGFGILELFPESIVTKFGQIVYREIRNLLIPKELRVLNVQATAIPKYKKENRVIDVVKDDRTLEISQSIRDIPVQPISRIVTISQSNDLVIYDSQRLMTIDIENRICTIEKENRTIQVEEIT